MFLLNKILVFCLSVTHLMLSSHAQGCANPRDLLRSNLIKNNAPRLTYCFNGGGRRAKRQIINDSGHMKFECIRNDFRAGVTDPSRPFLQPPTLQPYNANNYPFQEVIVRRDRDSLGHPLDVPVYLRAKILRSHTGKNRPIIPKRIMDYLDRMCAVKGRFARDPNADQAGHLLAHTLGGTTDDEFNFVPQVARLNTQTENHHSVWWGEEQAMVNFITSGNNRRIEWELLVMYSPLQSPDRLRLRPVSFCLRHFNYNENNQLVNNYNQVIAQPEPVMCFCNDMPDDGAICEPLSR